MEISMYSAGELVPPFEVRQAVEAGSIDCAHAWAGFYMGQDMANLLLASNIFVSGPFLTNIHSEREPWLRLGTRGQRSMVNDEITS
jgi:TRAP-type mannitol/chloroaromatic compound transport system substrate-binding protein